MKSLRVAARFCGPPGSANGGYLCGLIAAAAPAPVTVRLLAPTPLDTDLELAVRDDGIELRHGEATLAQARPGDVGELVPPARPSIAAASEAAARYAGFARHPAPTCFVCGPAREPGDALRIFAGPLAAGAQRGAAASPQARVVAAPWRPEASLAAADGVVRPEFIWAALDCPGFAALTADMRPMLLGELTARIDAPVHAGEPCVVIGWPLGSSGRKHAAATALCGADGALRAVGRALWIEPRQ